jgi:Kef-type K+ transport system membrane component KefB
MTSVPLVLITFGVLLLCGAIAYAASKKISLPHVSILILLGILVGPVGLDLFPIPVEYWFSLVSSIALMFIGFILGGRLSKKALKEHGKEIIWISIGTALGSSVFVFAGLMIIGTDPILSLLLAGIAPATAPAAVQSVVQETSAKGPFTDILLGVVAIDDAWGLLLFSILMAVASAFYFSAETYDIILGGLWDILGALLLGGLLGVPFSILARNLRGGEPMEGEAIGMVFICGGIALLLNVSFLLAVMMLGCVVVNLSRDMKPFDIIKHAAWPFMVIFFILSGATLDIDSLNTVGLLGLSYILLRSLGRFIGAWLGGKFVNISAEQRYLLGVALQPQAGVAIGMALIAASHFPEKQHEILSLVVSTTIIYEILGPIGTRYALIKLKEAQ